MITGILRQAQKKKHLNILCTAIHERISSVLSGVGHQFWLMDWPHCKRWMEQYDRLPDNYTFLPVGEDKVSRIPNWLDLDLVLIETVFGHYDVLIQIAKQRHIPCIRYEHTTTLNWSPETINQLRKKSCDVNVFITEFSRKAWGFDTSNSIVIDHGVDTKRFCPKGERKNQIVVVANDYKGRGYILGYDIFEKITGGLPVLLLGDTPPLSKAAESPEHLIRSYQESSIFLNTSRLSPQPYSMLEAAACGLCCISTATQQIPDYFTHGENALLSNNPDELQNYLVYALENPSEARRLGNNARRLIETKFSKDAFIDKWKAVFETAAQKTYLGVYP